jgi:DNA primase
LSGSFREDFVESVRSAGDIVQLVSDYVPLKPAGTRLKGLCPFHEEKTPSFSVDPSRQLFYCFGCQTGGDLFKFVMLYEKVAFPEALEILAKRFGVAIPRKRTGPEDPLERLLRMNNVAAAFYRARLAEEAGAGCRAYLARRRIDAATAERLGLGWAPESWDALRRHLLDQRFRAEEGVAGGLLLERRSGSGQYDRFRNRLIFPIRDLGGRTVAFGGRALVEGEPKYINSPETPAYTKCEHLYGLDLAKEAIRREGFAIVVEGYLDLAALVQAGLHHVVASLGTAFTEAQARLLARFTTRVAFSYDGDAAGSAATARSLDLLLARGFEVRVVALDPGQDPDDFIGRHGGEAYATRVREAPDYLEFLIRREAASRDLGRPGEQAAAVAAVLPHLARLRTAVERSAWAARLADALRIEDQWVLQELRSAVREARTGIRQVPVRARRAGPRLAERQLVLRLLQSAEERERLAATPALEELEGLAVLPIVRAIVELGAAGKAVDFPIVLDALADDADRDLLTRIAFGEEPESGPSVDDCLAALRRQRLARDQRRACRELGDLQQSGARPDDTELMRLQELARQRDALS